MAEPVPFHAAEWLNANAPLSLADFVGRVLAVEVFQMLAPVASVTVCRRRNGSPPPSTRRKWQ